MNMELRAARKASGKTQAQVAKEAGITERSYQRLEAQDEYRVVRTAIRIARALNSTVEALFGAATLNEEEKPDGNPVGISKE